MTVNLSMLAGAGAQFFDNNGDPLSGGKVYTYAAGTTTPQATYTTSAGNVAHANPIVLDSAGRVPSGGEIWLTDSVSYKFLITNSTGTTIGTYDNLTGNGNGLLPLLSASSGSSLVGFLQSGTSATARTVQDKLRETVSVKDFGAVGDGLTNDTAAVQAAATAIAAQGGGALFFPKGTYYIDNVSVIGAAGNFLKNVQIIGESAKILARPVTKTNGIIFCQYINGLEITGLEVDGNYANQTTTSGRNHAFHISNCTEVNIHHNYAHDLGYGIATEKQGDGLYVVANCRNIKFCDNTIRAWGRWVVAVVNACTTIEINNNTCLQYSTDAVSGLGFVDFEPNSTGNPIVGVTISNNVIYYSPAVFVSSNGDLSNLHRDIVISGNEFLGYYTDTPDTLRTIGAYNLGVYCTKVKNVVVDGNLFIKSGTLPAIMFYSSDAISPSNIIVSSNNCDNRGGDVVAFTTVDGGLITGNKIVGGNTSAYSPLQVLTSSNVHCIGNTIVNEGSTFPSVFSSSGDSTFANNFISGSVRAVVGAFSNLKSYGNTGVAIQYNTQAGATNVNIGPNQSPVYTNLVSAPIEGQKAVLPYFSRQLLHHSAAPTTGTWAVGDIVLNNNPSAGGYIGWVCTTAGSPGTWKQFGAILA